jgi:FtsH-binding integral membrane protein
MSAIPQGPFGGFDAAGPLNYRSREQELTVGQFFNAVYAWMAVGLAVTAAVSFFVSKTGFAMAHPGIWIVALVVQVVLASVIGRAVNRISASVATLLFLVFAAVNGVWLSVLFLVYTSASITSTFLVTAGAFGAMSLYGFVTKRDLTRLGSLLAMALIGLIIASIVNLFWLSPALYWITSYAGVLIFVGLTAFDTQRLKMIAIQTSDNPAMANRMAVVGSLTLYLDFINLFMLLLRLMGDRRQ